jgi:hypothetical protein
MCVLRMEIENLLPRGVVTHSTLIASMNDKYILHKH